MKINDIETKDIASAVNDVLEGKGYGGKKKIKSGYGEEAKYPHDMFHPETGEKVVAKNEKDHEELSKKGYTHEKPVKESPEEPRAKGEKEFKAKHVIKKSGENPDGTVTKEDVRGMKNFKDRNRKGFEARASIQIKKGNTSNKFDDDFGFTKAELGQIDKLISKIKGMHVSSFDGGSSAPASLEFYGDKSSLDKFAKDRNVQNIAKKYKTKVEVFTNESVEEDAKRQLTDEQKYKEFFASALKKYGVESPQDLDKEKRKEFFNYVDKNYKATNEEIKKVEEAMLKVTAWTGNMKKPPAGLTIAKSQSSQYGGYDVVFKGDEKALIKYAKRSLGVDSDAKTLSDVQREVN